MFEDRSVIAVIPARGGSKGIPRKNIKPLGGSPLISYTISAALNSKFVDRVYVSTDDQEIANVAKEHGAAVPFLRDPRYASDDVPNIPDTIGHIVDSLEERTGEKPDIVVLLEPTYPFRNSKTIDKAIEMIYTNKVDWAVTVSRAKEHPHRMRTYDQETGEITPLKSNEKTFSQRQELPELYAIRGAVYASRRENVSKPLNECSWIGVPIDDLQGIDIDEPIDFMICEGLEKVLRS